MDLSSCDGNSIWDCVDGGVIRVYLVDVINVEECPAPANPQTNSTHFGRESACKLPSSAIAIYYSVQKPASHFTAQEGWKAEST